MPRKQRFNLEERRKLADRLARLSDVMTLVLNEATEEYISVELGSGNNRNVMNVNNLKDRVSLYIGSEPLLEELTDAKLKHEPKPGKLRPWEEHRHWIWALSISDVDQNEDLFKRIVRESVQIVKERKSKMNQ